MTDAALALTEHPSASTATLPVLSGTQMVAALESYRAMQAALDKSMPDQIMTLDGKPFRKKGYWRAIRMAFNLSVESITPEDRERSVLGALEDGTDNYVYSVTYRATAPSGATAMGDGTCAAAEKQKGRMKATEHNVRSHAHTRAFNRAVSNLVGFGEVSAEEVDRSEHGSTETGGGDTPQAQQKPNDGLLRVADVSKKEGKNARSGKPWTNWRVTLSDGQSGGTFEEEIGRLAATFFKDGTPVEAEFEQDGKYQNLVAIRAAEVSGAQAPQPGTEEMDERAAIQQEGSPTVFGVAKVLKMGRQGDAEVYGIQLEAPGDMVLLTKDPEAARTAMTAKKNGERLDVRYTEKAVKHGEATSVERWLSELSVSVTRQAEVVG